MVGAAREEALLLGLPQPWLNAYIAGDRTRAAKGCRVAMIAAMHKLVAAIYSVAKHRRPFVAKLPSSAVLDP
jgi:hypothetical protein